MDDRSTVTIEWYTVEVTTYRRTFRICDLELDDGEDAASVLSAIARGETPYISTDSLVDYETQENERAWDCDDRSITKVTADEVAADLISDSVDGTIAALFSPLHGE